jgi:hypothetical protein
MLIFMLVQRLNIMLRKILTVDQILNDFYNFQKHSKIDYGQRT